MNQPTVLLVCSDLFFSTQLRSAAEQAGWRPLMELSSGSAAARAVAVEAGAVVVDLELSGLEIADLVAALDGPGARPVVIAFGPHVQERRLEAAAHAGCDRVLSRGQISATLSQVLSELSPKRDGN